MCAFKDVASKNPAFSPTYRTSFALSLSSHGLTLVIVSFVSIFDLLSDVSFSILFLLPEPLNFALPVEIAIACRSAAVMISCDVSPSPILARKRPPLCQKYLDCNASTSEVMKCDVSASVVLCCAPQCIFPFYTAVATVRTNASSTACRMRAVVVRPSTLAVLQLLLITSTRQISRWTNP